MDLGAVICKPSNPMRKMPAKKNCRAFQHDWIKILPVKEKKGRKNTLVLLFHHAVRQQAAGSQKNEKDIWENLYEFVLYEAMEY